MINQQPANVRSSPQVIAAFVAALVVVGVAGALLAVFWSAVVEALRAQLGPPLHRLHAPLDQFLSSLPMWSAELCAICLFGLGIVFAWSLPKRFVYLGAPDQARWRDLRIWATAVLIPYMLIYLLLGL
jgi:hypothetical protein